MAEGQVVDAVVRLWGDRKLKLVVFTGGEPLLQAGEEIFGRLKRLGFEVTVETNGTIPLPDISSATFTVSPKKVDGAFKIVGGAAIQHLKLVMAPEVAIEDALELDDGRWAGLYVQPLWRDGAPDSESIRKCLAVIEANPRFKLSTQTHKTLGVP